MQNQSQAQVSSVCSPRITSSGGDCEYYRLPCRHRPESVRSWQRTPSARHFIDLGFVIDFLMSSGLRTYAATAVGLRNAVAGSMGTGRARMPESVAAAGPPRV